MASFQTFINNFDTDKKGIQFEHFVKWFLINDPKWSTQTDDVWLWDEYPDRWGPDCGVDLVFRHKNGEIWAVQAKCYDSQYSITKKDVDTFLSESNRKGVDKRLLITSTDKIGKNARQVCKAQDKSVTFYLNSDFDNSAIDYPNSLSELVKAKPKPPPTPDPHQDEAIKAVINGFKTAKRGQMIMACGTGKTFTTLWIKEALNAKTTLVLLPSLGLVSQTLLEWTFASNSPFEVLCVCSDETIGKRKDEDAIISSIQDVAFPTTTNQKEIQKFLKRDVNKVVFSTYHSSPRIAEAQAHSNAPVFDLVIADEAHRCTGETGTAFTTVLDDLLIKSDRRLFTTATPRIDSINNKKRHSEMGIEIADMSNESYFGKVFHKLSFPQAIDRDLLTDYRVVIVGVDEPMIADWIDRRQLVRTEKNDTTDAKTLAAQIGLIKAINDYDLKRMISFHSRVKKAELFAAELIDAIDIVRDENQPKGEFYSDYVSGDMNSSIRARKLKKLKTLHNCDRSLLTNARCLSEGIDVPSLDGVAFIDPKRSTVDIVQAVGRAIRKLRDKSSKKTFGTIVLPVFIEKKDNAEDSIQSSNFKPVWDVLNALKSHDETLNLELGQIRTNLGRQSDNGGISVTLPEKIIIDLPTTIDSSFADSLRTVLVEKVTDSWYFWFGLLEIFIKFKGHALVPALYRTEDGLKLGQWVNIQRTNKEKLSPERISRLESLEGWTWDVLELQWEEGFSHLQAFVAQEGHARPERGYESPDGYSLGNWANFQRARKNVLTAEHISRLESLEGWTWDVLDFQWNEGFSHLQEFVKKEGHARPSQSYKSPEGYKVGNWVSSQRSKRKKLTLERKTKLESLVGWTWNILDFQWNEGFSHLQEFVKKEGHARPEKKYIFPDGFALATWVNRQRTNKEKLSSERISRLESLEGWTWDVLELKWEEGFSHLQAFVAKEGHAMVRRGYKTNDGFSLGTWVVLQRYNRENLTLERKIKLQSLAGWVWNTLDYKWEEGFSHLQEFVNQKGHSIPRYSFKSPDGYKLGHWISHQRINKEKLSPERISRLESLEGWTWDVLELQWEEGFSHLQAFVAKEGHAIVRRGYKTDDGFKLATWVDNQRQKKNKLSNERISKLESLEGWTWNVREEQWEKGFSHLQEFVKKEGHARPEKKYKSSDGYGLGIWVNGQRSNEENLTIIQKSRLESLEGWTWNILEFRWNKGFSHLQEFVKKEGHARPSQKYKSFDNFNLGTWVAEQRTNKNKLTLERKAKLESLEGWVWNATK